MEAEGIQFRTNAHVGLTFGREALQDFDAVVLCMGATVPRDLPLPGRELKGIHFAMDFLNRQNRLNAGDDLAALGLGPLSAQGKHVVVIGGGDTGSDCIGTSLRQKAKSVVNFEAVARPPAGRPEHQPWPYYPMRLRTSSSHEEGGERHWRILTKKFIGDHGRVKELVTVEIDMAPQPNGPPKIQERPGTERRWSAELVLIAIGYSGPETNTIAKQLGLAVTPQGAIQTDNHYMTSAPGIFCAGDAHRGQSLIVWAISEGREAAREVDLFLMGESLLPAKGCCDLPLIR
jgi:glutamate synthase (NADPH/NADH) small chain